MDDKLNYQNLRDILKCVNIKIFILKKIKDFDIELSLKSLRLNQNQSIYAIISKKIMLIDKRRNNKKCFKEEGIYAKLDDNDDSWNIIENTQEYNKKKFKIKRIIGVVTLILSIWSFVILIKPKRYTLKNLTQKEITIKINSEEIKLPSISDSKSEQKKNFKEDNFSIEILNQSNNSKKCEISFKNNSENRVIYFIENECLASEKIESYQEKYEYLLSNSTNNDIDLNVENKYYHLEKNHSMIIDLKVGNYSFNIPQIKQDTNSKDKEEWTELCNWNINYTSKGGLIKIPKNNNNSKTIYLKKNDNPKEPKNNCEIVNF